MSRTIASPRARCTILPKLFRDPDSYLKGNGMKSIVAALVLVPLMQAVALAQAPTADAKEGRVYVEGGIGFGVASMAPDASSNKGFSAEPQFGFGLDAEYGIT